MSLLERLKKQLNKALGKEYLLLEVKGDILVNKSFSNAMVLGLTGEEVKGLIKPSVYHLKTLTDRVKKQMVGFSNSNNNYLVKSFYNPKLKTLRLEAKVGGRQLVQVFNPGRKTVPKPVKVRMQITMELTKNYQLKSLKIVKYLEEDLKDLKGTVIGLEDYVTDKPLTSLEGKVIG